MGEPFPEIKGKNSYVAKHLTIDLWNELSDTKTPTFGFTLKHLISYAINIEYALCGIYASDWESYKTFEDIFDPIIQDYHNIADSNYKHTSDMDVEHLKGEINTQVPVKTIRIRVGRNIDGFCLPPGMSRDHRLELETLLKNAFQKLTGDLAGHYDPLTGMDEVVRQRLVENHLLFMSGDPKHQAAGTERDWPEGRGIYYNEDKTFLIWVNEEDQLRIISMQKGGDVRTVFQRLTRGIQAVEDSIKAESGKEFIYDPKYGFIHTCPTNLGTGMRASVHIDLPGWTKEGVESLKKRCKVLKLQIRGAHGDAGGPTGITFDISNKHRLGYTEVELVQCMIDGVNTLYKEDIFLKEKHDRSSSSKLEPEDSSLCNDFCSLF